MNLQFDDTYQDQEVNQPLNQELDIFIHPNYFICLHFGQHFQCPQVSPVPPYLPNIAELSGLRPEPRWGAQSAPQTPSSGCAGILV